SYEQKHFSPEERQGRVRVVASPDGREGSISINADAVMYASLLNEGQKAELPLGPNRHAWVHVASGRVRVNGKELKEGDGAALSEETAVRLEGVAHGEVLVFDLA
ncbi:MAG: pirin family protein, partial [Myxococcales bacterium]